MARTVHVTCGTLSNSTLFLYNRRTPTIFSTTLSLFQIKPSIYRQKMATSALNPNAPMFVPLAYREVEDFSDQWWDLVRSSPWFRDYWLHECFSDPEIDSSFFDITEDDFLNDDDAAITFTDLVSEKGKGGDLDLVALGWRKWRKPRGGEMPRYCEKAPKIVNVKVSPRPIQQPR